MQCALCVPAGFIKTIALNFCEKNSLLLEKTFLGYIVAWTIVLLLPAKMLSFCSCHVLLVKTGRSSSCLNCSLTGRRCWENRTVTTLSSLHCTAFASLFLLFALSLSLFSFQRLSLLRWQVSQGLPLVLTKDCLLEEQLAHVTFIMTYLYSPNQPGKAGKGLFIISPQVQLLHFEMTWTLNYFVKMLLISKVMKLFIWILPLLFLFLFIADGINVNCKNRHGMVISTWCYKITQIHDIFLKGVSGAKNAFVRNKTMQTFTWNQAIPHLRHFNNATKPPCILLLGVYSSDTAGFRDERLGMVGVGGCGGGVWK